MPVTPKEKSSQRATAKMLGVTQPTVHEDLKENDRNLSLEEKIPTENKEVINKNDRNLSLEEKSWFPS